MKWNDIKDGLPKTDVDVLITDGLVMAVGINDCYSCWQPSNVDVTYDMAGVVLDMNDITHWAELPELP
jgi:hypothetical protein